jgi:hypothetical protein
MRAEDPMDAALVQRLWDAVEDHRVDPSQRLEFTVTLVTGESLSGRPVEVEDGFLWWRLPGEDALREIHLRTVVDLVAR